MPKRLPGGRVKRSAKPAKAREQRPTPTASADVSVPVARVAASASASATPRGVPARQPSPPARQSLLSTVRRPAPKAGPALVTDYSYVVADLKRIGIVAGGAFVILVGLAFVIR